MKKKIIIIASIIGAIALIVVLMLLIFKKPKIVGTWVSENNKNYSYVFNKDKTGYFESYFEKNEFNYKVDGNQLIITYKKGTEMKFTYKINGVLLSIKDNTGSSYVYIKK